MLRSARTPWPLGENAAMEPIEAQRRSRSNGLCECLLVALALYGLAPRNASAGDQPQSTYAWRSSDVQKPARQIAAPPFPALFAFSAPRAETQVFSPTEFRPRKRGLEAADAGSEAAVIDAPMLRDTSIAGELSEAKTQDRVRLLTLWQSRASSLSLQAGKHGVPSLQWSTPWMHRDAASRGLFDRLLAVSPRSLGSTVRSGAPRQTGAMPAKPADLGTPVDNR
jgi:hypothetical protein